MPNNWAQKRWKAHHSARLSVYDAQRILILAIMVQFLLHPFEILTNFSLRRTLPAFGLIANNRLAILLVLGPFIRHVGILSLVSLPSRICSTAAVIGFRLKHLGAQVIAVEGCLQRVLVVGSLGGQRQFVAALSDTALDFQILGVVFVVVTARRHYSSTCEPAQAKTHQIEKLFHCVLVFNELINELMYVNGDKGIIFFSSMQIICTIFHH